MHLCVDQIGRTIELLQIPPKRIISLVPSLTELLYYFNLADETVGITKFCVHPPEWFKTKTRVGGTKNINISIVRKLQPDLVIANKEENVQDQIEVLQKIAPVLVTDVNNFNDALEMISLLGRVLNKNESAVKLISDITEAFTSLSSYTKPKKVAYLIWQNPYMAAGGNTFIGDMLRRCGFQNVFEDVPRYPETSLDELKSLQCDVIFLSSEPFPFKQVHADEVSAALKTCAITVDGEMFSWYGSRMILAADYFKKLQTLVTEKQSILN